MSAHLLNLALYIVVYNALSQCGGVNAAEQGVLFLNFMRLSRPSHEPIRAASLSPSSSSDAGRALPRDYIKIIPIYPAVALAAFCSASRLCLMTPGSMPFVIKTIRERRSLLGQSGRRTGL